MLKIETILNKMPYRNAVCQKRNIDVLEWNSNHDIKKTMQSNAIEDLGSITNRVKLISVKSQ